MRTRTWATIAAAALVALAAAGCGSSSSGTGGAARAADQPSASATATPTPSPAAISAELLAAWDEQLIPTLIAARDRARAAESGDTERAARLEAQMNRSLREVRRFGRDARTALLASLDAAESKTTIAAGDAWTEWANELLTAPPAGDFKQARRIADLGAEAIARTQAAYRAAGEPIPPAWRSA